LLIDKQIEVERILERLKEEHEKIGMKKAILQIEEEQLIV
jgi:hypothetical protein